jgi:hypothetical protein
MSGTATPDAVYRQPSAVSWGAPHLEVFMFNSQGDVLWKHKGMDAESTDTDVGWAEGLDAFTVIDTAASTSQHAPVLFTRANEYTNVFIVSGEQTGASWLKEHNSTMQWYPNGTVDYWYNVVQEVSTAPGITTWTELQMCLFFIGDVSDGWELWWNIWETDSTLGDGSSALRDADWSNFTSLSVAGNFESYTPTALSWGSQRIDVFMVGRDDHELYHQYYEDTGFMDLPESLGGYVTSRPVAVNTSRSRIDLFARGGDSGLWWLPFDGGYAGIWGNWTGISHNDDASTPVIRGEPFAILHDDVISVFAWSDEGNLLHKKMKWEDDNKWQPEMGMNHVANGLIGPPSVMQYLPGRLEIFAHIEGNLLGYMTWDYTTDTWSGWQSLGSVD